MQRQNISATLPSAESRLLPITYRLRQLPWWVLFALLLAVIFLWQVSTDSTYQEVFNTVTAGVGLTILVTIVAYTFAMLLGLALAFARLSKSSIIYHAATFFVEIIRGVPMLVLLLYVAFVFVPGIVDAISGLGRALIGVNFAHELDAPFTTPLTQLMAELAAPGSLLVQVLTAIGTPLASIRLRDVSNLARVIIALVIAYSAFLSEIFRAGIASIDRGQMEAARALGMGYWQAMRYVILPQAIRNVLPPLGNDFIAMLKDSSLVSVLGVQEITGLGRVYAAGNFRFWQTYNVMAFLYLTMTLLLSLVVRWIERRIGEGRN